MQSVMRSGHVRPYLRLFVRSSQTDTGLSNAPHTVWGRVVRNIPDLCRELVAALADE